MYTSTSAWLDGGEYKFLSTLHLIRGTIVIG